MARVTFSTALECLLVAHSGLFELTRYTSALGGKGDIGPL
jgi:hypothetical protein